MLILLHRVMFLTEETIFNGVFEMLLPPVGKKKRELVSVVIRSGVTTCLWLQPLLHCDVKYKK